MSFKHRLYLIAFAIVFLLLLFIYFNALEVKADEPEAESVRPRYTLIDRRAAFLFSNSEDLPLTVIREMCWNDTEGFCDVTGSTDELYILIDWETQRIGTVYEDESGACFWWMFQPEYGADNNPHIMEHYWIACNIQSILN